MTYSLLKFRDLRRGDNGTADSFEEFCCQIFRRAPEVPANSVFRRVRGDGGDGGVEALWTLPNGDVWGLQAKFFERLGPNQKRQIAESVGQAVANYPRLTRYFICLPINLTARTGARAGNPKRGQHEQLTEWIAEWRAKLVTAKPFLTFDVWDESEIMGRLASADTTGGLQRYWFDTDILTCSWFSERLEIARAQAGPRYSPELTVATPLDDAFLAFGRSPSWIRKIEELSQRYSERHDRWSKTVARGGVPFDTAATQLSDKAAAIVTSSGEVDRSLSYAVEYPDLLAQQSFRDAVRLSIDRVLVLEPDLREALLAKHGIDADSAWFRQWHAEYMADFPMAPLDHLRDLMGALKQIEVLAFQPEGQLPSASAMLVRGAAGVGKTHGIVDTAIRRSETGLLSVVLFGGDVSGPDPWNALTMRLGMRDPSGHDAILDALNAAAEATGFPLVIFIDALNETDPDRRKWRTWLPPMLVQLARRPFLKLCVSCRDIYLREVLPTSFAIPAVEHNGFLGREYEAQFAFFQHYGVGVPAEPLLQEEFANPLFLRLLCEALRSRNLPAIPAGREGIGALINLLLSAKNDHASEVCDFDRRENRVRAAMLRLAKAMASSGSRSLRFPEAKRLVDDSLTSHSHSLFAILESESLITTIEKPDPVLGMEAEYEVRFPFERIGDHLITEYLLTKVTDVPEGFAIGGQLHFLVLSDNAARANFGILEALSIQLPEARSQELIDVIQTVDRKLLWDAFIAGLQWRDPQYVTERTKQLILEALSSNDTNIAATEAVLGLTARPHHPLNVLFLDQLLTRLPLLTRDPIWANILEKSYSDWSNMVRPKSAVHRLIETARRGKLDNLDETVGTHWAVAIAWFCASPDRRIRDRATLAITSIFAARPTTIASLLRKFLSSDDEYISERVVVAAYGALLLNEAPVELQAAACIVYETYFVNGTPPLNASLRDHSRLIIEMSVDLGVPPLGLDVALYRPPYESNWPMVIPSEDDLQTFTEDRLRFPQMNLVEHVGLGTGTDFARYVVERRVLDRFDIKKAGIDKLGIFRWFLSEAVAFGYPGPGDQCALFDRQILRKLGGGRAKPGWAERLGKKYYWIFLRQLNGRLADHLDRKTWSTTLPVNDNLQGLYIRDIDPSDLRRFLPAPSGDAVWLTPAPYIFRGKDAPDNDSIWIEQRDFPDISRALVLTDPDGAYWQVIEIESSWNGKRVDSRQSSYRHVSRNASAVTCAAADIGRVKRSFSRNGLTQFHQRPHDYRGYLGEYPRRWPYVDRCEDPVVFDGKEDGIAFKYVSLKQVRGREWEYDYSQEGGTSSLVMPSVELVQAGSLRWDHRGGWKDPHGTVQLQDPFWYKDEQSALLCRTEYLDRYLRQTNFALIVLGLQMKFIAGMYGGEGRATEETLFIRHQGEMRLITRKVTRD